MKKLVLSLLLALFVANVQAQSMTDTLRHEVFVGDRQWEHPYPTF